jgi:hypothetical protein
VVHEELTAPIIPPEVAVIDTTKIEIAEPPVIEEKPTIITPEVIIDTTHPEIKSEVKFDAPIPTKAVVAEDDDDEVLTFDDFDDDDIVTPTPPIPPPVIEQQV